MRKIQETFLLWFVLDQPAKNGELGANFSFRCREILSFLDLM